MLNPKVQQVQSNNAIADSENEMTGHKEPQSHPDSFRYSQPPAPSKPQKNHSQPSATEKKCTLASANPSVQSKFPERARKIELTYEL